jgi:RNA polymerase sigma factor (sigma-70 family)
MLLRSRAPDRPVLHYFATKMIRSPCGHELPVVTMTAQRLPRSVTAVSATSPDEVLLARIQAGDEHALANLYDAHAGLVHGVARRVTRDEQLARDIVQDVFTYLWEMPSRVDLTRGSLRSYLAVVAHRRAVDEVRRCERRNRTEARLPLLEPVDGPEPAVVEASTDAWRRRRLADGLAELPEDQRVALELAYFDGLTYKQVAEELGIPEGTAKSRLRLAMSRLRATLGDEMRAAI